MRIGQVANVRLSAYKQRKVPIIDGHVTYVAADQVTDERTGQSYFTARVKLDEESLKSLHHVEMIPGMPAEVIMVNAKRRAIDLLRREANRAGKEAAAMTVLTAPIALAPSST